MNEIILPALGTGGIFELKEPLDVLIKGNENYTCKAIRKLSDYIANNEKPNESIYKLYGLSEDEYKKAVEVDMEIISLQNSLGHWLYIPADYIKKFPDINGLKYRMISIVVALPAMPIDYDYSFIKDEFNNTIKTKLGVDCSVKLIEASKPILVPRDKHDERETKRKIKTGDSASDAVKLAKMTKDYQLALDKIAELETYILSKE